MIQLKRGDGQMDGGMDVSTLPVVTVTDTNVRVQI